MPDPNEIVDKRVHTIIQNRFEAALLNAYKASRSARAKNPASGAWIIQSKNSLESEINQATNECLAQINTEINFAFRGDSEEFWAKVQKLILERVSSAHTSFSATLLKNSGVTSTVAASRALSQSDINTSSFVRRHVLEFKQRDSLKQFEENLKSNTAAVPTPTTATKSGNHTYVHSDRINDLRQLRQFDPSKLIKMCEEINTAFDGGLYLATILLLRSVLDHVPPIFGLKNFAEVANNYKGTKSFKEIMQRLESSSRKIADSHLHTQIRSKESLPNSTQVDFSNDLDMLLAEIIRISC